MLKVISSVEITMIDTYQRSSVFFHARSNFLRSRKK